MNALIIKKGQVNFQKDAWDRNGIYFAIAKQKSHLKFKIQDDF